MSSIDYCPHNSIGNSLITKLWGLNSANIDFDLIAIKVIDIRIGFIKFAEMLSFGI